MKTGMRKGFTIVALAGILALTSSTIAGYEYWDSHDRGDMTSYLPGPGITAQAFRDDHDRGDMTSYNPFPDSKDRGGDMTA